MSSRNPRRSATQWSAIIAEFRAGSEDEAAFCQRRQLNKHTFRKHRYRKNRQRIEQQAAFKEVQLKPVTHSALITVHAQGVSIDLPLSVAVNTVAQLARALQHER